MRTAPKADGSPPAIHTKSPSLKPPTASGSSTSEISDRWHKQARRAAFATAGARAIHRLRRSGYLIHVARPPEALVRFLGGGIGASEEDEGNSETVGSNTLRDRLVMEAVFQQRVDLPGVSVWLVTDDALLAEQAYIEDLNVGFGWLTQRLEPPLISSPFFDPWTLGMTHLPVTEFIDELLWSCGSVCLQRDSEPTIYECSLPKERRDHVLAACGEPGHALRWTTRSMARWQSGASTSGNAEVPRKAPTPQGLLGHLLLCAERKHSPRPESEEIRNAEAYLRALGWLDDQRSATERGQGIADRWRDLDDQNVPDWVAWTLDAGRDFDRISSLVNLMNRLGETPSATDEALARAIKESERTIQAQLTLLGAFGRVVRLNGKSWTAFSWGDGDAADALLRAVNDELMVRHEVKAVGVARVFTSLLRQTPATQLRPMSLQAFRLALFGLWTERRVVVGGGTPESSQVKIRVLVKPAVHGRLSEGSELVDVRTIDLGHGDFLIPNTACGVVGLPETRR